MPSFLRFLSSDPESGAVNQSASLDSFEVEFTPPLRFPKESRPRVSVRSAAVWWTIKNVSADKGNNVIYYTDDILLPQKFVITLVDGLYGLGDLNTEVNRQVLQNGHIDGLLFFSGVAATSRVWLGISQPGFQVTFTEAGTIAPLLGYTRNVPPAALTVSAYAQGGDLRAELNTISSILLHSSIAAGASGIGGKTASALAAITPDVAPSSLINYEPYSVLWVDVPRLAGAEIEVATFRLTDQTGANRTIDTNGEHWRFVLEIEY